MSKTETGGTAFPAHTIAMHEGMTLRDYFAAKAMPTEFKDYWDDFKKRPDKLIEEFWRDEIAQSCYSMADAMIRAREA